jgi:hypothetical protein
MVLHVNSVSEAGAGKVRVGMVALQPLAVPPIKPNPSNPYPNMAVVGQLTVTLNTADAASFQRGSEFELAVKA